MQTITEAQYAWAAKRVEELWPLVDDNTQKDDPHLVELDMLIDLVESYEKVHYPIEPPTLSEILKLRMFELGLTQANLAKKIGVSPSRITEYLSGEREPTLKIGRKMNKELGIPPGIILGI